MVMRYLMAISVLVGCTSCGVAPQPTSLETVAAYEVPLPTPHDRAQFLTTLREVATAEGGHLDAASDEELRQTGEAMPAAKMTVHAGVWRGQEDNEGWATVMDQADHIGLVWIMFAKGKDEALARRFRERAMGEIVARWPDTISLPILGRGNIPLHRDLVRTPAGYKLNPSAAFRYNDEPKPAS